MDIANIIAMIVALIAVALSIFSTLGAVLNPRKQPEEPDEDEFEEEEEEEFEEVVQPHVALPPPPPPPPPRPVVAKGRELPPEKKFATEKFTFHAKLDDFTTKTAIEGRELSIGLHTPDEIISDAVRLAQTEGTLYKKKKRIPAREVIEGLSHKKLLWISHEIVSKPVSRRFPFPWNG